ncbi:trypsin-like serine peptidase [Histidinibacterium aquaticum]|uniref:Trypsin-like serine protease n=1 Tax=Histidinibacterium aquaticum TaxID=2613962 RepID=A0A5J5GS61_9RHOB|nr:trypsin-like serine protease [Histidinibacterium aquaticum]KAA9010513.1 trypsin-like serine protease [Histidinibacterium aquaticum]
MLRKAVLLLGLWAACAMPAVAQQRADSGLTALQTGDAVRGWEAVGRLDIDGKGFCTASLIAEDLVLTAAHCLYESGTGERIDPARMEFLAGLRDGRALAYRDVRRAVAHPDYLFEGGAAMENVLRDVALLELVRPIRTTNIIPFELGRAVQTGESVGIVSYAMERAELPSLQEMCSVLGEQAGVWVMSCDVNFGSSGAPVFSMAGGQARIVSLVSAKAEVENGRVALGMALDEPLARLREIIAAGGGQIAGTPPSTIEVQRPGESGIRAGGAKFVRP